jgi:hypothetical protein
VGRALGEDFRGRAARWPGLLAAGVANERWRETCQDQLGNYDARRHRDHRSTRLSIASGREPRAHELLDPPSHVALAPHGASKWNMPVDFLSLFTLLNGAGVRYVVTGGLAVILHGVDRLTADLDVAIDLASNAPSVVASLLTDAGFRPMAPVKPFDRLYAEASGMTFRGITLRVASIPHLIEMKRHAGRDKDLADIKRLQEILRSGRLHD